MILQHLLYEQSWKTLLREEFAKNYMVTLAHFLDAAAKAGTVIFPPEKQRFAALNMTSFKNVRIVIIGQDPYHGRGQAMGLSFSVVQGVRVPPSLRNIYKELAHDLQTPARCSGDLSDWATQGVLLLNASLSVAEGQAASHRDKGWERFTDVILRLLNQRRERLVFMLWGKLAQQKADLIDPVRHLVLQAPHPSPLSAHRGFFGCRHFSKANAYLTAHGKQAICWG